MERKRIILVVNSADFQASDELSKALNDVFTSNDASPSKDTLPDLRLGTVNGCNEIERHNLIDNIASAKADLAVFLSDEAIEEISEEVFTILAASELELPMIYISPMNKKSELKTESRIHSVIPNMGPRLLAQYIHNALEMGILYTEPPQRTTEELASTPAD